jgi:peptide/nickel transport system ATP-binding protein
VTTLHIEDVSVRYGAGPTAVLAVDQVSLMVPAGGVVGVVGESGSGKSTLARAIVGLAPLHGGRIMWDGAVEPKRWLRRRPSRAQLVFQNPYASLDPRLSVGATIGEAVASRERLARKAQTAEVGELLDLVGLPARYASMLPRDLSGGQRQRVAIARALAARPDVLIADEITSALDVSVQGAILNLLSSLREQLSLGVLFISHNLSVVRYISDRVAVMYLGRVVENAPVEHVVQEPAHPYTRVLLEAVPRLDVPLDPAPPDVDSEPPDPHHPPSGCHFHPRCPMGPRVFAEREICVARDPSDGHPERRHAAMCHFA